MENIYLQEKKKNKDSQVYNFSGIAWRLEFMYIYISQDVHDDKIHIWRKMSKDSVVICCALWNIRGNGIRLIFQNTWMTKQWGINKHAMWFDLQVLIYVDLHSIIHVLSTDAFLHRLTFAVKHTYAAHMCSKIQQTSKWYPILIFPAI